MQATRLALALGALAMGTSLASVGSPSPNSSPRPAVRTAEALRPVQVPTRRHGHRAHLIGDTLIVFGGFAPHEPQDGMRQTLAFDVRKLSWRRLADMHIPKAFFGSALVGRTVYAV